MKNPVPKKIVLPRIKTRTVKKTERRQVKHDYLKYLSMVKNYAKSRYGLHDRDFELILFLYSEKLFTRKQIEEYTEIIPWDKDRFYRLMKEGWIHEYMPRTYRNLAVYELTRKAKKFVAYIYAVLNGELELPEEKARSFHKKKKTKGTTSIIVPGTKRIYPKKEDTTPRRRVI